MRRGMRSVTNDLYHSMSGYRHIDAAWVGLDVDLQWIIQEFVEF